MMMARQRQRGFGAGSAKHLAAAELYIDGAKHTLRNIGPTCKSHIRGTFRAMEALGRAQAHLNSVSGPLPKKLVGRKNALLKKANQLSQKAADSCSTSKQLRGSRRRRR